MKTTIALVILATAITLKGIAQQDNQSIKNTRVFEIDSAAIARKYSVDLGKGNSMQVELLAPGDMVKLVNIDSLLHLFQQDIQLFKDSLSNELAVKRIDYVFDPGGKNKLRLLVHATPGASFLVANGDVSALRLEQDTINLLVPVPPATAANARKRPPGPYYCRVRFLVNQFTELANYTDGFLNGKMTALQQAERKQWVLSEGKWKIKNGDLGITAARPGGNVEKPGDYLTLEAGVGVQNYKHYFVPSFSLNARVNISSARFSYELGGSWEPNFFFAKNSQGTLQTFRNDFLVLNVGMRPISDNSRNPGMSFNPFSHISVGYLVGRRGDFMDAHTFRLGTAPFKWKNRFKLEPVIHFHDFFRNVTPGLRFSVSF